MFDLSLTKEQMLKEINASHSAFVNRFRDPGSQALVSLDEACLVIRGPMPDQLWPVLCAVLSKRFAHVAAAQLFSDLIYPLKKGLGNAYKWGNKRDTARNITVEAVLTTAGAVVSISDEGQGFNAEDVVSKIHRAEHYFTHGGSGFRRFAKTKSSISYADGGRTLLVCYRCASDAAAAGPDGTDAGAQTRLAAAMRLARAKVCLVSYPASGGTWLRALIGKAISEKYGLEEHLIFREPKLTKAAGVLRTVCTHGDADIAQGRHYKDLETNLARYESKKVILLIRDPRDVVVSCYFHARGRTDGYKGSISDFVRSDHHGIRKIVAFYNIWQANRHVPEVFLPTRYDDLHADPGTMLRRALALIDSQNYSDAIVTKAVEYGRWDHARPLERERPLDGATLKHRDDAYPDRHSECRVRRGGYSDYLNEDDQAYVNSVIDELSDPLFRPPITNGCGL